jgi:hypothetical protein
VLCVLKTRLGQHAIIITQGLFAQHGVFINKLLDAAAHLAGGTNAFDGGVGIKGFLHLGLSGHAAGVVFQGRCSDFLFFSLDF